MKLRVAAVCLALLAPPAALAQEPIAAEFSRSVAAILVDGDAIRFVMVEPGRQASARVLAEGDAFKDGWTVKEATSQSAVLRKGPTSVVVDLTRFKLRREAGGPAGNAPANAPLGEPSHAD